MVVGCGGGGVVDEIGSGRRRVLAEHRWTGSGGSAGDVVVDGLGGS